MTFPFLRELRRANSFSCLKILWACFYYCGYPVILTSQFTSIVSEKYNLGCFETIERKKTEKCSTKIIDKRVKKKNANNLANKFLGAFCLYSMVFNSSSNLGFWLLMLIFFVGKLNFWGRVSSFSKHYPYSLCFFLRKELRNCFKNRVLQITEP